MAAQIKSPFPGMDPYLEIHWRDVHQSLITYARDAIQAQLPGDLRARTEERVWLEAPESTLGQSRYPDVFVVERDPGGGGAAVADLAVAEPVVIELAAEPIREGYVEIVEVSSRRRVITVIEFLSPTNKLPGPQQMAYLEKQAELFAAQVSLVEVDLLRTGHRVLAVPAEFVPPRARTLYQACIRRSWKPSQAEVYPIALRERLPVLPIPLRPGEKDVRLDLQLLLDRAYANAGYDDIDYSHEPQPPLGADDAAWAGRATESRG